MVSLFILTISCDASHYKVLHLEPHQTTPFAAELDTNQVDRHAFAPALVGVASILDLLQGMAFGGQLHFLIRPTPKGRSQQSIQRAHHTLPTPIQHMGINHGCGNIRMSKQFLDRANVITGFQ